MYFPLQLQWSIQNLLNVTELSGQNMDPAETERLKHILATQGVLVGQHDTTLRSVMESLQHLTTSVNQLGGQMENMAAHFSATSAAPPSAVAAPVSPPASAAPAPVTPASLPCEPHIPIPAGYAGDLGTCAQFLHQCSLVFNQQPATYFSDQSKIAFVMSLLVDRAASWALAISNNNPLLCSDFQGFSVEMKRVFDHPVKGREAAIQLLSLRQSSDSVAQFSVNFRILAADSGWDQAALKAVFLKGLSEEIKDELAVRDETKDLDELIELAIRLDNRLRERRRERSVRQRARFFSPVPYSQPEDPRPASSFSSGSYREVSREPIGAHATSGSEEPMQLGRTRLTPAERERRLRHRLCIYCGQEGHFRARCPALPKGQAHQPAEGRW